MGRKVMKSRSLRITCALALALSMTPIAQVSAFADDGQTRAQETLDRVLAGFAENLTGSYGNYDYADNQAVSSEMNLASSLPEKYDLRDEGYVTDVRLQNPWGTCWAFGITAAAEISVLSESETLTADMLDLSERHLAWFSKTHLPAEGEEGYDPCSYEHQSGEGAWFVTEGGSSRMSAGYPFFGAISYASGMGVVAEYTYDEDGNKVAFAPYRNDEGLLYAYDENGEEKDFSGDDSVQQAIDEGYTDYAEYAEKGTWALSESKRFAQTYALEESNILPSVTPDESGNLNTVGVTAFKNELVNGHGIAICYALGGGSKAPYRFNRVSEDGTYYHYTWSKNPSEIAPENVNHCATIVGYDDTISADNFTIVNPVKCDANGNKVYRLKETGEDLVNEESTGLPYYPGTSEVIKDESLYVYSYEQGATKTTMVAGNELPVYRELCAESDLGYDETGTTLVKDGKSLVKEKIMQVSLNSDGSAKRDENNHPIYKAWGTGMEYKNDQDGNPLDENGNPIADKVVVEESRNDVTYKPQGDGAWIVKNSWGSADNQIPNKTDWGSQGSGYFYLSYYDNSVCYTETFDFAVTETEQADLNYKICYEYDYMPAASLDGYASLDESSMANIFTAQENSMVKNLSCETWKPDTTVEYCVYKLKDSYTNPTDGTLVASATSTYDYAGYHRVDLDTPVYVAEGDAFSVVVTEYYYDDEGAKHYTTVANSAPGVNSSTALKDGIYFKGVVNEGESFLSATSEGAVAWTDWNVALETNEKYAAVKTGELAVDNFSIKAYAEPTSELSVTSEGASFAKGEAACDAVFTFGENIEGLGIANFDTTRGVLVDGVTLDTKYYLAEQGSIKLTLYKDYLNTLEAGTHTVRVYLQDSASITGLPEYVDATLTVSEKGSVAGNSSSSSIAKTGDAAGEAAGIIGILALCATGAVMASRRKVLKR